MHEKLIFCSMNFFKKTFIRNDKLSNLFLYIFDMIIKGFYQLYLFLSINCIYIYISVIFFGKSFQKQISIFTQWRVFIWNSCIRFRIVLAGKLNSEFPDSMTGVDLEHLYIKLFWLMSTNYSNWTVGIARCFEKYSLFPQLLSGLIQTLDSRPAPTSLPLPDKAKEKLLKESMK